MHDDMQDKIKPTPGLRALLTILAGCTLPLLAAGCGSGGGADVTRAETLRSVTIPGAGVDCVTLYAGQTIVAGSVCTEVMPDVDTSAQCGAGSTGVFNVTYGTEGGWTLHETHVAVGDELGDLPVNPGGNPQPGQYPYGDDALPAGTTSYAVWVPLCVLGLDGAQTWCEPVTAYVAAHAVVRKSHGGGTHQEETAWGDGERFTQQGNWGMYFTVDLECEHDDGEEDDGHHDEDDGHHDDDGGHHDDDGGKHEHDDC